VWTQIVGKIRLALEPMVNHWWHVPLYVSAHGLTTSLMHSGTTGLEIEFDLVDHVLVMRTSDGRSREVRLEPCSVASFPVHFFWGGPDLAVSRFSGPEAPNTYEAAAELGHWDRAALEVAQ
jgi:Family of unknown function (DUF5996)